MHLSKAGILIAALATGGYAVARLVHPPAPRAAAVVEMARPPTAAPVAERLPSPPARVTVYVAGDVRRPGVYALATGSRIVDAYRSAGGAASDADPIAIDLAALVHDGEEIVVPRRGERLASSASDSRIADVSEAASPPAARRRRKQGRKHRRKHVAPVAADDSTTATAEAQSVVDVNAASAAELETLPGIGPALADRIVRFRELNGRFASSNELADVAGMTSGKLDAIAPYARY